MFKLKMATLSQYLKKKENSYILLPVWSGEGGGIYIGPGETKACFSLPSCLSKLDQKFGRQGASGESTTT